MFSLPKGLKGLQVSLLSKDSPQLLQETLSMCRAMQDCKPLQALLRKHNFQQQYT